VSRWSHRVRCAQSCCHNNLKCNRIPADLTGDRASIGAAVRAPQTRTAGHEATRDGALATQIGMPFVDLDRRRRRPARRDDGPERSCAGTACCPIGFEDGKLVVAMSDPSNVVAMDDVRTITKMDVKPVVATKDDVLNAIGKYAVDGDDIEAIADDLDRRRRRLADLADLKAVTEDAPIVKFVNLLITQAVADGASDIHIEPGEKDLRVRYRIDGVLHEVMRSPRSIQPGVISRLKIMAEVDIAERRIPQDGRIGLTVTASRSTCASRPCRRCTARRS
jgi:type IV pilus assembly protein PilB